MGILVKLKLKMVIVIVTATIMILDNVTTLLAVSNGAVELNPIVSLMVTNPLTYILFTIFKTFVASILVYKYINSRQDMIVWLFVMLFYIKAIIVNTINTLL